MSFNQTLKPNILQKEFISIKPKKKKKASKHLLLLTKQNDWITIY